MANFDGIIPELAKAGFIKKVNDLRSQISTLQQEIDTISESTKTMFWSNSIPSDLGTVGELQSFSTQVKAYSLIDVPPTYSIVAGSLPSGLTLNPINGYITGVVGNYETITPCVFTVQAADNQTTITKQFTITVNAVNDAPTWITASELGDMTVDFISIQLSVNDPDSTPTFTIVDGSLPTGVTLSSSGLISGDNPRDNLTYTFTVEANDGVNQVQRQFTFVAFNEAPVWVTDGNLGTITGSSFSKSLSATDNDSAVLTYSVNPLSELPVGVSLSVSGVLSGLNPLTNTTHTFDIDVSDGVNVITRTFFFYAYSEAPVWVSNASLGSFDTPTISIQLRATDAENEPLTYAVVAGSLPTGLTLTSSGLISGNNPFDGLTSSFTISVSDKANSVNREFSITCEVAAGEAIYTSVGNYSFTVPMGVREIDALVVAGSTGFTSVGNIKATKGGFSEESIGNQIGIGVNVGFVYAFGSYYTTDSVSTGTLKKSTDLVNWETVISSVYLIGRSLYFDGTNLIVVCGSIMLKSTNGTSFSTVSGLDSTSYKVKQLNGEYIFISSFNSSGNFYKSSNLSTFQVVSLPLFGYGVNDVEFANGIYVAVGGNGKISTSTDLVTWTARTSGVKINFLNVLFFDGYFYTYGDGKVLRSSDGVNWAISATLSTTVAGIYLLNGVLFAVGGSETLGLVYTSVDGVNFIDSSFGTVHAQKGAAYVNGNYIVYGSYGSYSFSQTTNNFTHSFRVFGSSYLQRTRVIGDAQFITSDAGVFYKTSDNVSYTKVVTGSSSNVMDICSNGSIYVTVGSSGGIYSSSDSTSWIARTSGVSGALYSVAYGNGMFLAQKGGSTSVTTSQDGIAWNVYTTDLPAGTSLRDIIFDNGIFIGVGTATSYTNGLVVTSTDGITWNVISHGFNATGTILRVLKLSNSYIFLQGNSTSNLKILKSQDLVNFTQSSIPTTVNSTNFSEISCDSQNGVVIVTSSTDVYLVSVDNGSSFSRMVIKQGESVSNYSLIPSFFNGKFYFYKQGSIIQKLEVVGKTTTNTDATLTRPSTEGFSLTNPNNNGNYGKLSGIAGYKNNIPVNPSDTINVSVPSLDGAVRIIWGGIGRDFPNNAV